MKTENRLNVESPRVSVIIPAYNASSLIKETLDSVFAQTFKDYSVIVVNDGSPDTESLESVLRPYGERIRYFVQENQGTGVARNRGIDEAKGDLLAFIDADDLWEPRFLETLVELLDRSGYDVMYSDALMFGEGLYAGQKFSERAPSEGEVTFESLVEARCNILMSATLARRQSVVEAGLFPEREIGESGRAQDFILWLRMALRGCKFGYVPDTLARYRIQTDSLSGDSVQRVQREIDALRKIARDQDLSEIQIECVEKRKLRLEADIQVELGKGLLKDRRYKEAIGAFRTANEYRRSSHLRLIIFLTRYFPAIFRRIFLWLRKDEIPFMPTFENE